MAIGRSPNYPTLTLEDAIEKVRKVYKENHTYPTTKEVVVKALGYGSLNGGSLKMLGSLKRYGLLENEKDGLKVTDKAVSIIELPSDDADRIRAIEEAALHTELFAELYEKYGDKLPSDALVKHYLVTKKFLPKAADEVIRIYRANLEFVNGLNSKYNISESPENSELKVDEKMQQNIAKATETAPPPIREGSRIIIDIPPEGDVQVNFSGQMSFKTFGLIESIMRLTKPVEHSKDPMFKLPDSVEDEVQELDIAPQG